VPLKSVNGYPDQWISVCDSNAKAKLKQPAQATNAASLCDATDSANMLVVDEMLLMLAAALKMARCHLLTIRRIEPN
jgi:hypothetical protein